MIRSLYSCSLAAVLALLLPACDRAPEATPSPTSSVGEDAKPASGADAPNDGVPDLTPAPLTPGAERGETGARTVLLSFARAIELKEFDQAWEMLGDRDKARWDRREFAQLFADLGEITVAAPEGMMEGAAGSSYYTAPLSITGESTEGRPVRYDGEIVLRRVNDVPGADEAQLRWHIDRIELDWSH